MKAIILAAGIASRLRPLTDSTPKCLLEINGKSLLKRCIDNLIVNDISELVVVTGYLREMIETFITQNYPSLKVEFIYNDKYSSTNNIYSLWLTKEAVATENILLLDSDILFESQIIGRLLQSTHPDCLALNNHPLGEEEIKVIADNNGLIKEISKTCSISDAIGESIGIEKFSTPLVKVLFDELDNLILKQDKVNVFYEVAFENIIQQGSQIYSVDTTDLFSMELDTVEDFEHACEKMPSHLH